LDIRKVIPLPSLEQIPLSQRRFASLLVSFSSTARFTLCVALLSSVVCLLLPSSEFVKKDRVLALYPGTTTFYPSTVLAGPKKVRLSPLILFFLSLLVALIVPLSLSLSFLLQLKSLVYQLKFDDDDGSLPSLLLTFIPFFTLPPCFVSLREGNVSRSSLCGTTSC
jgi:hypothetical protein